MTLTIICPESKKHKTTLNKALEYVGIIDYVILDPAHHEIPKVFYAVLFIGQLPENKFEKLKSISKQAWWILPPNPIASKEEKQNWIKELIKIKDWMLDRKEPSQFKKSDIPTPMQLEEFLNSLTGRVVSITLPDRRKLGIYPDNQRLQNEYDIEYHASTIVNIAKLFNLFDALEITIKEL